MESECLTRVVATVRLPSCSSCQLAGFRDNILTPLATVWSMSFHVLCQVVTLRECFPTLLAPVWLHVFLPGTFPHFLFGCFLYIFLILFLREFFTLLAVNYVLFVKRFRLCCVELALLRGNPQDKQSRVFSTGMQLADHVRSMITDVTVISCLL